MLSRRFAADVRGQPLLRTEADAAAASTTDFNAGAAGPGERWIVGSIVVLAGANVKVAMGASVVVGIVALLLPMWAMVLRRFRFAVPLLALAAVALISGWLLSEAAIGARDVLHAHRLQEIGLYLSGLAALVAILWARTMFALPVVVVLYGMGGFAAAIARGNVGWKGPLGVAVALLVVGLTDCSRRRLPAAAAAFTIGILAVSGGARSFFAFCVLAAVITVWQMRPAAGWAHRWFPAVLLCAVGFAFYQLSVALLTGGYLGSEAQTRSIEQIDTSGSLITGGRPEWTATVELMRYRPMGYGIGVVPAWDDVRAAEVGLAGVSVELEPNRMWYMFGSGQFRLHSIAADLWVRYGLVGLAFAGLLLLLLVRGLSFAIAERRAATSLSLIVTMGIWQILFSPIHSGWVYLCVAVGLVLPVIGRSTLTQYRAAESGVPQVS